MKEQSPHHLASVSSDKTMPKTGLAGEQLSHRHKDKIHFLSTIYLGKYFFLCHHTALWGVCCFFLSKTLFLDDEVVYVTFKE